MEHTTELDEVPHKMASVHIWVGERSLEPKSGASENQNRKKIPITGVLTRLLVSELSCLCINGLVHKGLESITMMQVEITTQLGVETLPEPSLLLGIRGHFFFGITGEVLKLSTVSINSHLTLGETTELFSLAIKEGPGNVMLAKSLNEIPPSRNLASWKHSLIVLPPNTSRAFQVI